MRAIIIDDKDARELLGQLKLEQFQILDSGGKDDWAIIQKVHAKFHYVVCRWLQDQGANMVRQ